MTAAALGQVRRWSAAGLDAVAVRLEATGRALAAVGEALERARPPDAWRGAAADAARAGHERVATLLRMLAADVVTVQAGARAASDAVGGIRAALAEAQDLADANGFTIAADGTVADTALSDPGTADTRPAVQAEIVDRVEQVLRASAVLDADLAALLMAVAQSAADPAGSLRRRRRDRCGRAAGRDARGQRRLVVRAVPGGAAQGRRRASRVGREPRRHPVRGPRRGEPGPARRAGRPARRRPPVGAGALRRA